MCQFSMMSYNDDLVNTHPNFIMMFESVNEIQYMVTTYNLVPSTKY